MRPPPTHARVAFPPLSWLRESLKMLNPSDPHIAPNAKRILSSVHTKLSEVAQSTGDDSEIPMPDLMMATNMLKKLLAQCA